MTKIVLLLALCLLAVPAKAQQRLIGQAVVCDKSAVYDASSSGATQLVAASAGKTIHICGFSFFVGATATNVSLVYGTGAACITGQIALTPAYQIPANGGVVDESPFGNSMPAAQSNAVCVKTSAGNAVQALVRYSVF